MSRLIQTIAAVALFSASQAATSQTFTTEFDGVENPLSEGGVWSHVGLDWAKVQKSNGIAFGTQSGNGGYDDSYAYLSGFGPDQSASAKVHLSGSIDGSCSHEVEILLRWSDNDHNAKGYEINMSFNGSYSEIVRWNGAIGDFTRLQSGSYPSIKDGDILEASIAGDLIRVSVNGNPVIQVRDSTYATGNPGIGFFRRACGTNADVGFQNFTATGSNGSPIPAAPTNVTVL